MTASAQQTQPPAYAQHDPQTLNLPSVPTHTLPSLRSLDLPDAHASRASIELSPKAVNAQWLPPPLHSAPFSRVADSDVGSPMEVDRCSVISGEDRRRETSVLSVDDPDVRLAAEALSGLGNPGQSDFDLGVLEGFARLPPTFHGLLLLDGLPTMAIGTAIHEKQRLNAAVQTCG